MRDAKTGLITHQAIAKRLNKVARRRRVTRLPYAPLQIYIDPCNACDLRCTFCPQSNWGKRKRGMLKIQFFDQIMKEVVELRPYWVNLFCFGESLLHPRIFEMVSKVSDAGLRVRIHTNARSLDEEKATELLEANLTELHFSFDTPDKELYNRMRVRSDFDLVLSSILRFLELKKAGGYEKPDVLMQEVIPYRRGAKLESSDTYKKLFEGHDVIYDPRFMHNFGGGSSETEFAAKEREGTSACAQIYKRLVVTFDGKIHACCMDAEGYNIIGDLAAGDTIAGAWNGEAMRRIRRLTNEGKLEGLPPCDQCDQLQKRQPFKLDPVGRALWAAFGSED